MNFSDNNEKKQKKFPPIEEVSVNIPAVSEYCPVTKLPELYKEANTDTLPVINMGGKITGIVSEYDLAQVVPELSLDQKGYQSDIKVYDIMTPKVWVETKNADISHLFDKIHKMHTRVIPIVEKNGVYTGNSIIRTKLIAYLTRLIKPNSLGGLATPFGVYITDGVHQAGTGNFGLFATGVLLGLILVFVENISGIAIKTFNINMTNPALIPIIFGAQLALFIMILRLTPLVKIHAAEHKTINAIEQGMPLTLETVKMQPKEHKRCGTNIMVLLMGIQFIILIFIGYIKNLSSIFQFIFLFTGFMVVFSNWHSWGMLMQKYITTVNPPDSYIYNGIKTGEEILNKHKDDYSAEPPSFLRKIWCMSLIQILAGFIFIQWLMGLIIKLVIKFV